MTLQHIQALSAFGVSTLLALIILVKCKEFTLEHVGHIVITFLTSWICPIGIALCFYELVPKATAAAMAMAPLTESHAPFAAVGGLVVTLTSLITIARIFKTWLQIDNSQEDNAQRDNAQKDSSQRK